MSLHRAKDSVVSLHEAIQQAADYEEDKKIELSSAVDKKTTNLPLQRNERWIYNASETEEGISEGDIWEPGMEWQDLEYTEALKSVPPSGGNDGRSWLCCLFPWLVKEQKTIEKEGIFTDKLELEEEEDDDDSTLLPKDDPRWSTRSSSQDLAETLRREGGIMQRTSVFAQAFEGLEYAKRITFHPKSYQPRPEKPENASLDPRRIRFFPVTYNVRIKSWKDMTPQEHESLWWQMRDFDLFKAEISLLAQAEEMPACAHFLDAAPWLTQQPTVGKATSETQKIYNNLQQQHRDSQSNGNGHTVDENPADDDEQQEKRRSKSAQSIIHWWHKYGQSRRGLEKYASPDMAKETIVYSKMAIQTVLREQQRNRSSEGKIDPEKLAQLYHEYSAWARDLALAAAASDADAVTTDFDDSKRKSREFYLLKQIYKHDQKIHKHMPQFMIPKGMVPKGYLDDDPAVLMVEG